jgi:putative copper resistance protein D
LIDPLTAVRDIHFASSVVAAGILAFDLIIAAPTWRMAGLRLVASMASFRRRCTGMLWICLVLSLSTGFGWLCLLSGRITGRPLADVMADGTIWTVLSQTRFGYAWQLRSLFWVVLAALLLTQRDNITGASSWRGALAALLACAYLGMLAFAGHGEEGLGFERDVHLAADFLHLTAAGLWLGGLVPLALLLFYLRHFREPDWIPAACQAASRFSNLGILAVGLLLVTGTINAWFLTGGMQSLVDTGYGRLLLLKIALFAAMVALAGINRQYLLPRLRGDGVAQEPQAVRWLVRNTLVEITIGMGIIIIVGMLGIMAPATDMAAHGCLSGRMVTAACGH